MEEHTMSSAISCINTFTFVIVLMVYTAQGATKLFSVDAHKRQISGCTIFVPPYGIFL